MEADRSVDRRAFLRRATTLALAASSSSLLGACRREEATLHRPTVAPASAIPIAEPIIRVRIDRRRDGGTPVVIGRDRQWMIIEADHGAPVASLIGPVIVRRGAQGWSVIDKTGYRARVAEASEIVLRPLDPATVTPVRDRVYPGVIRCVALRDPSAFDVVNDTLVESYLPGVLAGELYSHWHPETFAAQAVAARSFACSEIDWWRTRRHYDVTNTTASQVYEGTVAHERAIAAVARTRGSVMTWKDHLVPGYYSSCCGGVAADARFAIGPNEVNAVGPLRGRDEPDICKKAPLYAWSIERSDRDVVRRLAAFGAARKRTDLAKLRSVSALAVHEAGPRGRPRTFAVRGRSEETLLSAEDLRRAVDFVGRGFVAPSKRLYSTHVRVSEVGRGSARQFRFEGRGHGHGVGLCQYGAQAWAKEGRDAPAILSWYYPDMTLRQAYG